MYNYFIEGLQEAGCDEAGRGCLAGPVFASAVILPADFFHPKLNDSKKLDHKTRELLRPVIEQEAVAWAVASCDHSEIDQFNILRASIRAMHKALDGLNIRPEMILVDGNRFYPYKDIRHECIVKGDGLYYSIAAASVLAKTYRDDLMRSLHEKFPEYGWNENKGYGTEQHRKAILQYGTCDYHRKSFRLFPEAEQLHLFKDTDT
jgi:ribonuclease HII